MKPRFSLRRLLIAFALLAVLLHVCVVRPTSSAERFAAAVLREDYSAARAFLIDGNDWDTAIGLGSSKADHIYADVMPREWQDILRCRRRIVLRVSRHEDRNGGYIDWTEDSDIVAYPGGLVKTPPVAAD
jgi:hypothetical protein